MDLSRRPPTTRQQQSPMIFPSALQGCEQEAGGNKYTLTYYLFDYEDTAAAVSHRIRHSADLDVQKTEASPPSLFSFVGSRHHNPTDHRTSCVLLPLIFAW
eukprot:scaffold18669_cov82-Skeletonema_dohrnii-CCMP3373.AAC.3